MKDIKKIITETVQAGGKNFIRAAVNQILSEDISVGQKVAIIDDPISGYSGARAQVKSISDANPGFASVALENGTQINVQTSLLVPV